MAIASWYLYAYKHLPIRWGGSFYFLRDFILWQRSAICWLYKFINRHFQTLSQFLWPKRRLLNGFIYQNLENDSCRFGAQNLSCINYVEEWQRRCLFCNHWHSLPQGLAWFPVFLAVNVFLPAGLWREWCIFMERHTTEKRDAETQRQLCGMPWRDHPWLKSFPDENSLWLRECPRRDNTAYLFF